MKPFVFCPACATRLGPVDHDGGATCPACGRTWYRNSAPTVGAAITSSGRVLLTVRARPPHEGRIDVPGGFLKPGEHPLEGLRREVAEELGVEIDVAFGDFVQAVPHTYGEEQDWVLSLGFAARLVSGEPRPADDVAGVVWAQEGELDGLDFAWEHDRELARAALRRAGASREVTG